MRLSTDDTIAAIATAAGGAPRGVVRVSGPRVASIVAACFQSSDGTCWDDLKHPTRIPGSLRLPLPVSELPADLWAWPGNRSYTRQPTAEFHTFGSPPLLHVALEAVCRAGARLAEPGEFTLRAFLAGRLDLTQVEAVLGVIDAESPSQLETALQQLAGGLATPLHQLRQVLLELLADVEAGLDFVEEDIEFVEPRVLAARVQDGLELLESVARQLDVRGRVRDRFRVVLWGSPNAGKSSLMNALCGGPRALVSAQAGTTRDYVTHRLEWPAGIVELTDTAGLAAASLDELDAAAQMVARQQWEQADLRLLCLDATQPVPTWALRADEVPRQLVVCTKCDLPHLNPPSPAALRTSAVTGSGIDELRERISAVRAEWAAELSPQVTGTAERCGESIRAACTALQAAARLVRDQAGEELVAAELRQALEELGQVVGAVYTDDVLDQNYRRF